MNNPVLVELQRGAMVESVHRGRIAIVDADGALAAALGDIDAPVYPRSAVKALQALPHVESGAADRLALTDAELAIACASHNGEDAHVATAAGMLAKAGVDEAVLECGAHWPYLDTTVRALAVAGRGPTALHNNCSGKHAGFVCLGCILAGGQELRLFQRGYVLPDHPVMREVSDALGAATAMLGEKAAMACTVAVEETIDEHYRRQAERLGEAEPKLKGTIEEFREDELEHRDTALAHGAEQAPGYRPLTAAIRRASRVAIWLSERF